MRQAGRFLPEYRRLRERHSLLEICGNAELAKTVTLQPVKRFGVDGAIIFADILLPLLHMGVGLDFVPGRGPVIQNPIRSAEDVEALRPLDPEESLSATLDALRAVKEDLPPGVGLIGFAGGPFTVASYLIEGESSRSFLLTKQFMFQEPVAFGRLLDRLARATADYMIAQARAGADVLQLFDTWAGCLSPAQYVSSVQRYTRAVFESLEGEHVPTIHFGVGAGALLEPMRDAGGDVIGLDWRTPLDEGWQRIGFDKGVQGNLDPAVLLAPEETVRREVSRVLEQAGGRPGHVFNLGHGVFPQAPIEAVHTVVDAVRGHSGRTE
jgi:uroporphyrinogen decarboxylase